MLTRKRMRPLVFALALLACLSLTMTGFSGLLGSRESLELALHNGYNGLSNVGVFSTQAAKNDLKLLEGGDNVMQVQGSYQQMIALAPNHDAIEQAAMLIEREVRR